MTTEDLNMFTPTGEDDSGTPPQSGGDEAIQSEALEQGWVPQDQWHGRPEDWTDAETFVKRGREINPILRKTLKKKDAEIEALRNELSQMKGTVAELAEHKTKIEKLAYDRALADLRAQRKDAMASGDVDRFEQVEEAIDQLKEEKPTGKPAKKDEPAAPVVHPAVQSWMDTNKTWYNDKPENSDLVDYAHGLSQRMVSQAKAQGQNPDPEVILAAVAQKVRQTFPSRFQGAPAMFDGGGSGGGGSGKGKGFGSLPADAKAQFERFYSAGYYPKMKKEEAQAQYFADYQ